MRKGNKASKIASLRFGMPSLTKYLKRICSENEEFVGLKIAPRSYTWNGEYMKNSRKPKQKRRNKSLAQITLDRSLLQLLGRLLDDAWIWRQAKGKIPPNNPVKRNSDGKVSA